MLAEYSPNINPEHGKYEHVLRLQNPSPSTIKNRASSEHVLGPIPNLLHLSLFGTLKLALVLHYGYNAPITVY